MDSDLVLISRVVLLNDERAFADLMKKYQRPVRRYFLVQTGGDEALSDDLAQETFIHAWQHLDSFHGLSGFGTWLYRIAHNTWCNWYARHHDLLSLDNPAVIFPSMHVLVAFLITVSLTFAESMKGKTWIKIACWIYAVVVSASTVLVKQHSIKDVWFALAFIIPYSLLTYFVIWPAKRFKKENQAITK